MLASYLDCVCVLTYVTIIIQGPLIMGAMIIQVLMSKLLFMGAMIIKVLIMRNSLFMGAMIIDRRAFTWLNMVM